MEPMKDKIEKPKEFTDAEAEAFNRYLTKSEKPKKKSPFEALLEKHLEALSVIEEYLKKKGLKWK